MSATTVCDADEAREVISFLQLLQQITTNFTVYNNRSLFSRSSGGQNLKSVSQPQIQVSTETCSLRRLQGRLTCCLFLPLGAAGSPWLMATSLPSPMTIATQALPRVYSPASLLYGGLGLDLRPTQIIQENRLLSKPLTFSKILFGK